jgi:hypothetical protein
MVDQQKAQNEVWMNPGLGTVFVMKMDHRGELTRYEQVNSGRRFNITSEERRLNMEKAANESLNVFRNGTLQPVRLIAEDEESRELASNPNAMSESDMKDLVSAHFKTFEHKVGQINNTATLERLLVVAHDQDATIKRVERIEQRITETQTGVARPAPQADVQARAVTGRPVSPG